MYKVGSQHMADLARIRFDASKVNIVTKEAFDQALGAWLTSKLAAMQAAQDRQDRREQFQQRHRQQREKDT